MSKSHGRDDIHQYLTFTLASEQYAIRVTSIREVLELPSVTRVPRMPHYMRGVINLRGSVVPVVDLKAKFGIPFREGEQASNIIVTEVQCDEIGEDGAEQMTIGIYADSVRQVLTFDPETIEDTPRIGIPVNTDFLAGMGKVNGEFVLILDIDRALNAQEIPDADGFITNDEVDVDVVSEGEGDAAAANDH
ncbi:MAG: chemotaxis protein CheW [Spirochaetales bacterium]|nr:chemotaxis protein CheW [Spirochaetales bacterium]